MSGGLLDYTAWRGFLCAAGLSLGVAKGIGAQTAPPPSVAVSQAQRLSTDTMFFAEGLATDARTGTLFVTSIRHRNVLVVESDGRSRWLIADAKVLGIGAVFGAVFDETLDALWITTARLPMM